MPPPDFLDETGLRQALASEPLGRPLFFYEELPSTHAEALLRARNAAAHGSLLVARRQPKGRGRQDRHWQHDAAGGLAMSWIVRPQIAIRRASDLVHVTALAVHDVLIQAGVHASIKWPNDLVVVYPARPRKLAGILVESASRGAQLDFAVVSVGLNVNTSAGGFEPDLRQSATSVAIESGRQHDRIHVVAQLCRSLHRRLEQCAQEGLQAILPELRRFSCTLGQRIRLRDAGPWIRAIDLDARGALVVEDAHGERKICLQPPVEVSASVP